jgi:acyl-CoA thioesterase
VEILQAQAAVQLLYQNDRFSKSLGIEIMTVAPGRVEVAMSVRADMLNGHNTCHGGIIFALADSAFAFACNARSDAMVAAGASIEFLAPTLGGERVTAVATETSRTERHGIYDVSVTNSKGEVVGQFRGRCSRLRTPTLNQGKS